MSGRGLQVQALCRLETAPSKVGLQDSILAVLAVLPFLIAVCTATWTVGATLSLSIICATNVFAVARLRHLLQKGPGFALDSAFWLLLIAFFLTPFAAQVSLREFPLDRIIAYRPSDSDIFTASVAVALGAAGYHLGWSAAGAHTMPLSRGTAGVPPFLRSAHVLRTTSVLAGLAGIAVTTFALARHGVAPFLTSRQAVEAAYYQTGSELNLAHREGSLALGGFELQITRNVAALGFLYMAAARARLVGYHRNRLGVRLTYIGALSTCALINGPVAASRTVSLSVAFAWWLVARNRVQRQGSYGAKVAFGLAVLLLAFPLLDHFRTSAQEFNTVEPMRQLATSLDYSPVEQSIRAVDAAASNGHTLGSQVAGAALVFVPRSMWDGKPQSTTYVISDDTGLVIGTPIWAEGYVEWGLPGAFAYAALLGALVRVVGNWGRQHTSDPLVAAVTGFAVGIVVLLARGDLLSTSVTVYGLAGIAVALIITRRAVTSAGMVRHVRRA